MLALAHPGLLWTGAALASVPILIHLFFRRRHRVVRWAAMDWLLAALRKQKRRMQIENLILLLVRCALIALLGLAVARPAVQAAALDPFGGGTRGVVLVIDSSASMGAQQTGRRAFDRAKERALTVLGDLASDSKVTLVSTRDDQTGGAPRALIEKAAPRDVRSRLAALPLSHGPNRLGPVFRLVGRKLDPMPGSKLVVYVTDLQRRDWRADRGARREDVYRALRNLRRETDERAPEVVLLDVGAPQTGNVVITRFSVEHGREAFAGSLVGLSVRLANYGPATARGTLTLYMTRSKSGDRENKGGKPVTIEPTVGDIAPRSTEVELHQFLPKGSEGPARFEVVFTAAGSDMDRLPDDSRRFLALNVKPPVRFLPVSSNATALDILRDVADVVEVIEMAERVEPVALATANLDATDAILWADPELYDPDFEDRGLRRLERFVERGGGLVAYLGTEARPDRVNKLFFKEHGKGLFPMLLAPGKMIDVSEHPVRIDVQAAEHHPLFQQPEMFGSPEILQYWKLKDCPKEKIVARYENGDPAVIEHKFGRGTVLIVTTTPDERAFRLNGSLLPAIFFFNAAHYLVAEDPRDRNVLVGMPVKISLPMGAHRVVVEPPESAGGRTEEPVADASKPYVLSHTVAPGFYRMTVKGVSPGGARSLPIEEVHDASVNLDGTEGDLRRIEPRTLEHAYQGTNLHVTTDAGEILPQADAARGAGELSRSLLMGVVILLLAELLLAWRFGSRRRAAA